MISNKINKIKTTLFIMLLIVISVSGCLKEEKTEYSFKVSISDIKEEGNVTVIIPFPEKFPENKGELIGEVYDRIEVYNGSCYFTKKNTTHGVGLNINTSSNRLSIKSKGKTGDDSVWDYRISMKGNETQHWIYSTSNCSFRYNYEIESTAGSGVLHRYWTETTNLTEGWQLVKIKRVHEVS